MQETNQLKKEPLTVFVRHRDGEVFRGRASSITSWNAKGKFDILPGHANFICLIEKTIEIKKTDGSVHEIPVDNGVLRIEKNHLEIYLGIKKNKKD